MINIKHIFDVTNIILEQGPKGLDGFDGKDGDKGDKGERGYPGERGIPGKDRRKVILFF